MWKAPEMWKNGECFIIGGGPSMLRQFHVPQETVTKVIKRELPVSEYSPYLKALHDKHIIGINMAFQLGDWVDVLFFGDHGYFKNNTRDILQFPNLRVTCTEMKHPMIKIMGQYKTTYGLSGSTHHLCWNHNSGGAAIDLAVHFGVKRIILLGFDMDAEDNHSHWHKLYADKSRIRLSSTYKRHLKGFPVIQEQAEKLGVEILNANPDSKIKCFKKVSVKEIL